MTRGQSLSLIPVAGSCFVVIIAQSAATSRAFAIRYHERVDDNADILGVSAANAAAALSGAFVVNGSPTQTAIAERAGARSQVAHLAFAMVVLVVLLFLTGPLQYLPRGVLAAIVFTIAVGMIDIASLRSILRESRDEFFLAIMTTAAVVAIGVEQGILLAVALSLMAHVRHSYRPHAMMLVPDEHEKWIAIPAIAGKDTQDGVVVYRFGADLFYANINHFADGVLNLVDHAPSPVRWFVIDASAITDIDYSAARGLRGLLDELARRNVDIVFARVSPYLQSDLERHDIIDVVGKDRGLGTLHEAIALATRSAPPIDAARAGRER